MFTLRYVKEGKERLLKVHVPSRKFIRGNFVFRWIVVKVAVVCWSFQLEKRARKKKRARFHCNVFFRIRSGQSESFYHLKHNQFAVNQSI